MTPNNANIPKDRISQQHLIDLCIHQKFHLGLGKYGIYQINTRQNSTFGKESKEWCLNRRASNSWGRQKFPMSHLKIYLPSVMTHDTHGVPCLSSLLMIRPSCYLFETLLSRRHSLIENQLRQSTSNSIKKQIHHRRLSKHMSGPHSMSLSTLPIELVYRILDHLTQYNILISAFNVCTRWNSIIDTYQPYQVTFTRSILWFFRSRQLKNGLRPCAMWKREKQWLSDLSVTFEQSLQSLTVSSWRMLTRQNSNFCTIIPSDLGTRKITFSKAFSYDGLFQVRWLCSSHCLSLIHLSGRNRILNRSLVGAG